MPDEMQTTALTAKTIELGKAIVREATKHYEDERRGTVIQMVSRLMVCRDDSVRQVEKFRKAAEWYSRKLAAIDAGEFDFDLPSAELKFHDPDLARANY